MKSLVIIPAYNEEENIKKLIEELSSFEYDYLIINDGSKDNTEEILQSNSFNHLNLPLNVGLAGVTKIGFMYAKENDYEAAVVIDGDGQHNPIYIEKLLKEIEQGYDYVVGSRFVESDKNKSMRMIGSRIICFFIRLKTGCWMSDPTSGMRALSKRMIDDFATGMNFIAEPDALTYALHHRYKVKEVQVEMREREGGTSYFRNPFKAVKFMFETIISIIFIQW